MIPRVGTCTKLAAKSQDTHRKGLELTLAGPNDWGVLIQWNGGMVEWNGMEQVLLQHSPTEWLTSVPAT